ncbi:MAG TPA: Ig-like domain-containing protein, partial [Planctomycetota bacterium]|nr:Ig-like domain-containing protein [Planctomycetota bacterium]
MLAFGLALLLAGPEEIVLLPREIRLHGPAARQTLLVERVRDGLFVGPAKEAVEYASSDPAVVRVENGAAVPVGNGAATITATSGGRSTTATVKVVDMDRAFARSFRNHVQPVLARFGCSTGACHGAAAGKNGFRLSLRGYDDEGDYRALTRHAMGRRIDLADPSASLLLGKATGAVPHKGGVRFDPGSREFHVLGEWIAAGAPGPRPDDPRISRIEVLPSAVRLQPGDTQPLIVLAHFTDGSVFDATPWAKYTGSDSTVAVPDDL